MTRLCPPAQAEVVGFDPVTECNKVLRLETELKCDVDERTFGARRGRGWRRPRLVLRVEAGVSVLDTIRSAGVDAPSSCEMGICGTCETKVLSGTVDHRDELLTEAERAGGSTMMICVSRSCGPRLLLDR